MLCVLIDEVQPEHPREIRIEGQQKQELHEVHAYVGCIGTGRRRIQPDFREERRGKPLDKPHQLLPEQTELRQLPARAHAAYERQGSQPADRFLEVRIFDEAWCRCVRVGSRRSIGLATEQRSGAA